METFCHTLTDLLSELVNCFLVLQLALIKFSIYSSAFPFSAVTLLVGRQEGHPACKKNWMLVCWW